MYSKKNPDKLYIGSTKQKLNERFNHHRYSVKSGNGTGKLPILFSNDDVVIELVENIIKCSKQDALSREDYYIEKFGFYNCNCSSMKSKEKELNRKREFYKNNKEYFKQWYIKNKKKDLIK